MHRAACTTASTSTLTPTTPAVSRSVHLSLSAEGAGSTACDCDTMVMSVNYREVKHTLRGQSASSPDECRHLGVGGESLDGDVGPTHELFSAVLGLGPLIETAQHRHLAMENK